jgi:hypothetical protein
MNHSPWLEDRRWRWRVIVLVIVLIVVGAFIGYGYDPLAAIGAAVVIFSFAAVIIGWIINERGNPPPTAGQIADLTQQFTDDGDQRPGVSPAPDPPSLPSAPAAPDPATPPGEEAA